MEEMDGRWSVEESEEVARRRGLEWLQRGEPTGVRASEAAAISQSFPHQCEAVAVFQDF